MVSAHELTTARAVSERRVRRSVASVLNSHGWRVRSVRPFSVPGQPPLHPAYRVTSSDGQILFVKMRYGAGGLTAEQHAMVRSSGVPMPRMLARYAAPDSAQCEVYEFVGARNALELWPQLTTSMRRLVARYLAAFSATLTDFGRRIAPADFPRVDLVAQIMTVGVAMRDVLGSRHPFWSLLESLSPTSPAPVLCHGDLNAKNLLITTAGTVMLVDWEWTAMAEPAYEMKNVRAAAARDFRELASTRKYYEALSGVRIDDRRLLLADIDYTLIQLRLAGERGWRDWQTWHKRRLAGLVRRYDRMT